MDWLNAFDPTAPQGSARTGATSGSVSGYVERVSRAAAPSSPAGPSRPPQNVRNSHSHQASSSVHRNNAKHYGRSATAPPPAALRSEDAQPNENQVRSKPWEISAPPTISKARTKTPVNSARPLQPPRTTQSYHNPKESFSRKQRTITQKQPREQHETQRGQQSSQQKQDHRSHYDHTLAPPLKRTRIHKSIQMRMESRSDARSPTSAGEACPDTKVCSSSTTEAADLICVNKNQSVALSRGRQWQKLHQETSDKICQTSQNDPKSLIRLLQLRSEIYHSAHFMLPRPKINETTGSGSDDRIWLCKVVKLVRGAFLDLLGLDLRQIDAGVFCSREQAFNGASILIQSADELTATTGMAALSLKAVKNLLNTFGARVLDLTWSDLYAWQQKQGLDMTYWQQRIDAYQACKRTSALEHCAKCAQACDTNITKDDGDDHPLAACLPEVNSRTRQLDGPSTPPQSTRSDAVAKWPTSPFEPKVLGLKQPGAFSGAHGISIKYFVPMRCRTMTFDAGVAVSEHGRIAVCSEERTANLDKVDGELPHTVLRFQASAPETKANGSRRIDRVEDVTRLTSKVCGIASSTRKLLGMGSYDEYPCQVSLVTVDEDRVHRPFHLDERPHTHGAASITHFPRTDPDDASSIDFASGGMDGAVNHWRWKGRSTQATTSRLHTLHDVKPVIALEHLSSNSNMLASASIGTVVGFDLAALTLGFSWNTSDHIVHLQRTPDPKLMLALLARRDYDQFRIFDITGGNGPISRPVISFGWLNNAAGNMPLGRGSFHPSRRAIFAHGAEDGYVRVWDMRNPRDPLIQQRLGDEPIVQAIWASPKEYDDNHDTLYVATTKGVRSISLLAP